MPELSERLQTLLLETREDPTGLTTEDRQSLAELFDEATEEELAALADVAHKVGHDQPGNARAQYARALALENANDSEAAGNLYLQIAQHLAAHKDWSGTLEVAMQAMPVSGDYRLVRLVRRAGEKGQLDITAALALARQECGDSPDLLWERSQEAASAADVTRATELALLALKGYVAVKEPKHAEDPLLFVLEAGEVDVYRRLLDIMRSMARHDQRELLGTLVDLAGSDFLAHGLSAEVMETVGDILRHEPELTFLRAFWAQAVIAPHSYCEDLDELTKSSGLDNPELPLDDALNAFSEAVAFSSGAYVGHRTWGVGRIREHEDGELVIDFEDKPRHRMAAAMARQVLTPLKPESLQVQRTINLEQLKQEAEAAPGNLICRLLEETGGEIVTADIKLRLVGWLVPEEHWSSWWKKARKALEEDSRVDCSQAFRQLYRLGEEGVEAAVPLPTLDPRKGLKGAVSLLVKLLEQHPDVQDRARAYYGPELELMLANTNKASDWVRGLPFLIRWYPAREKEWLKAIEQCLPESTLTLGWTEEDQRVVFDLALRSRAWKDAAYQALSSRFQPLAEAGLQVLQERLGEHLWDDCTDLLLSGGHFPEKMAIAELALAGSLARPEAAPDELPLDPWHLLHAALSVLGAKNSHAGRGTANRLLRAGGPLSPHLKRHELPEATRDLFSVYRRKPIEGEVQLAILGLLEEVGQESLANQILRFRQLVPVNEEKLPPELDARVTLMTRATFEVQTARLQEMEHQLHTEIPREIAKARALGDLSENAEYHAARERQGITKALHDSLLAQVEGALIIEEIHRVAGLAGVGTQVTLRDVATGEEQTVWILGEGDSQYGSDVVSYKAPLGQALVRKQVGEVVQVGEEGPRYEILVIVDRLPG